MAQRGVKDCQKNKLVKRISSGDTHSIRCQHLAKLISVLLIYVCKLPDTQYPAVDHSKIRTIFTKKKNKKKNHKLIMDIS